MATKKEKKSQLSCSFANVPGAGDCLAILLFLGYLWNNQFNWADGALCLYCSSDLSLYFLQLASVCATWQGNGMHSASQIPGSAHPCLPLPIWFLGICLELLQEKKKKWGKGTPAPTLQTHFIEYLLWLDILGPREKDFMSLLKWSVVLGCSL